MVDFWDRLQQLIANEKISINKFEDIIGTSRGVIAKSLRNKTDIGAKWIAAIEDKFPHYSLPWLLSGKGEMLNLSTNEHGGSGIFLPTTVWEVIQNQAASLKARDEQLTRILENQDATNKELIRQITELNRKIDKRGDYADNAGTAVG